MSWYHIFNHPDHFVILLILIFTSGRVLVFSLAPIELVQIQIDDGDWTNATNIKGPLYVVPWNPKEYENGVHNLNVRSRDAEGRERGITQPFCLDGTRLDFRFWPRVALMTNISIVVSIYLHDPPKLPKLLEIFIKYLFFFSNSFSHSSVWPCVFAQFHFASSK